MAATALIKFTQGALVGTPGQVVVGTTSTLVIVENDVNTGVNSWQIDLVYTPPGSTVPVAIPLAFNNNSSLPTTTFTPDVAGPYRIVLKVWDTINRSGSPTDTDIRVFWIPDTKHGFLIPPYQKDPNPLPSLASGAPHAKPNELNVDGQEFGWDGGNTIGLLHSILTKLAQSEFDAIPDLAGSSPGQFLVVAGTGVFPGFTFTDDGTDLWITKDLAPGGVPTSVGLMKVDGTTGELLDFENGTSTSSIPVVVVKVGGTFWTSDFLNGQVVEYTPGLGVTDSAVLGSGSGTIAVAYDGTNLWATDIGGSPNGLVRFDPSNPSGSQLPVTLGAGTALFVAYEPTDNHVWVTLQTTGSIIKVTLAGVVAFTLTHVNIGPDPIILLAAAGSLWATDPTSVLGTVVHRINPIANTLMTSIVIPGTTDLGLLTYDSVNNKIWVYATDSKLIYRIDVASNTLDVGAGLPVGPITDPGLGGIYAFNGYVWVTQETGLSRALLIPPFTLSSVTVTTSGLEFLNSGDIEGTTGAVVVVGLQDNPIDPTPPAEGDLLVFLGGSWTPLTKEIVEVTVTGTTLNDSDQIVLVNTVATAKTVNLPVTPRINQEIIIKDQNNNAAINNITVGRNFSYIDGIASDVVITTNNGALTFRWTNGTGIGAAWRIV
jgi:hypothetical protein